MRENINEAVRYRAAWDTLPRGIPRGVACSGPAGKPVNVLFVAKKMQIVREMYFAILLDRASAGAQRVSHAG